MNIDLYFHSSTQDIDGVSKTVSVGYGSPYDVTMFVEIGKKSIPVTMNHNQARQLALAINLMIEEGQKSLDSK